MLQSPPSIFPDSSLRLQTMIHGRSYLSPVHGTSVPHQTPVPPIDPTQFRGFVCHQGPQRLPHFSLAIPPREILPQYQPHAGFAQTGYPAPGLLSSGRVHLDSYSQTLFNLSQQAHASPQTIPHPIGIASQQHVNRQATGNGAGMTTERDGEETILRPDDRFSVFGMVGYMEHTRNGRFPDKNSAQDLSLKAPPAAFGHRWRQSKKSPEVTPASPFCHSQTQPQIYPLKTSGRVQGSDEIRRENVCQSKNEFFAAEKLKDAVGSWIPYPVYPTVPQMDLSFKDPNSVDIHHPSDRNFPLNGLARYPPSISSGTVCSLSPTVVYGSQSPVSSSAAATVCPSVSGRRPPVAYHRHFSKGSTIQLASGQLKRVEELRTEDFLDSCGVRADLSVDTSRVTHIRLNHDNGMAVIGFAVGLKHIQVTVEASIDHPFFVFDRGWSSCNPSKTLETYGLSCLQLAIGDTCISLTHKYPNSPGHSQFLSDRPPADEVLSSLKAKRSSSREYKTGSLTQSPEPLKVPADRKTSRDDPGDSSTITSRVSAIGQLGRLRNSRKRRWSAPDNGTNDSVPAKSPLVPSIPLEINRNNQPPVLHEKNFRNSECDID